jgi:hypothetical protein
MELWTTLPPAVRTACSALPAAGADEVNADAGKKKAKKGAVAETVAAETKRWLGLADIFAAFQGTSNGGQCVSNSRN